MFRGDMGRPICSLRGRVRLGRLSTRRAWAGARCAGCRAQCRSAMQRCVARVPDPGPRKAWMVAGRRHAVRAGPAAPAHCAAAPRPARAERPHGTDVQPPTCQAQAHPPRCSPLRWISCTEGSRGGERQPCAATEPHRTCAHRRCRWDRDSRARARVETRRIQQAAAGRTPPRACHITGRKIRVIPREAVSRAAAEPLTPDRISASPHTGTHEGEGEGDDNVREHGCHAATYLCAVAVRAARGQEVCVCAHPARAALDALARGRAPLPLQLHKGHVAPAPKA